MRAGTGRRLGQRPATRAAPRRARTPACSTPRRSGRRARARLPGAPKHTHAPGRAAPLHPPRPHPHARAPLPRRQNTSTHARAHTHTHKYTHMHMHMHTYMHTYAHAHTCTHARARSAFIELFSPRVDPNVQGCSLPLPHHEGAAISTAHDGTGDLPSSFSRGGAGRGGAVSGAGDLVRGGGGGDAGGGRRDPRAGAALREPLPAGLTPKIALKRPRPRTKHARLHMTDRPPRGQTGCRPSGRRSSTRRRASRRRRPRRAQRFRGETVTAPASG